MPPRPLHTVGTDLFHIDNDKGTDLFYVDDDKFLLIADYYTKYQFVRKIPKGHSTSKCVTDLTKQIFCEQGIPRIVRSDNGPYFQGYYRQFAEEYGFSHVTSSPNYRCSNGFIESQLKSIKKVLKKAKRSHSNPNTALLCLRATPINNKVPSPAELLLGRQIQDNLPRKIQTNQIHDDVIHRLQERQAQQKYYYDKHTTVLPGLVQGEQVTVQNPKTLEWKPAEVHVLVKIGGARRSYIVSTPSGKELPIRQIPQGCPKQVTFDLERNQVHSSSPGTECSLPINQPSQVQYQEQLSKLAQLQKQLSQSSQPQVQEVSI